MIFWDPIVIIFTPYLNVLVFPFIPFPLVPISLFACVYGVLGTVIYIHQTLFICFAYFLFWLTLKWVSTLIFLPLIAFPNFPRFFYALFWVHNILNFLYHETYQLFIHLFLCFSHWKISSRRKGQQLRLLNNLYAKQCSKIWSKFF